MELEDTINNSSFFSTFDENTEAVRATAKAKLVLDLWKLSQHYWPKVKFEEDYFSVINDTILRCMERFKPEKAIFTNFFKNQVKFAIMNQEKKEQKEKFVQTNNDDEFADVYTNETIENNESFSSMTAYLDVIEHAFIKKQDRVKPWLRTLWTRKCFNALAEIDFPDKEYTWIDYEFLEKYRKIKKIPSQKEIAAIYGRVEQDASRAIRQFRELVEPQLKNRKNSLKNC